MKPIKSQEQTLTDLAARSAEGAGAAKRFEALAATVIRTPRATIDERAKAWKEARTTPTAEG